MTKTKGEETMDPQMVFGAFMIIVALLFVLLNDWWKRRLVRKAEAKGKVPKASWRINRMDKSQFLLFVIVLAMFFIAANLRSLRKHDRGSPAPLIQHLVEPIAPHGLDQ